MKKIKQTIINLILIAILFSIAIMICYNLYYFFAGFKETNYLLKFKQIIWIISEDDMMSPYIDKDEIVVFKKCNDSDLKIGDVVYLKESETEKIAKIENIRINENGDKYYITKGEKNYYYNQEDVTIKSIKGKFEKKVNFVGNILRFASSRIFSAIIVSCLLLVFFIMERNYNKSLTRRKKKRSITH